MTPDLTPEPGPVEGADVWLRRTEENVAEIDELADLLGVAGADSSRGVDGVLADLNRQAVRTRVPGRAVRSGYRWDDEDERSRRWWPQGVTTSADASDEEVVGRGGHRVLAASWYSKSIGVDNKGSRLSLLDLDALRYRHVLLVEPVRRSRGDVDLAPLKVHAGGIVWCGPYLHVAGTAKGMFSARMDDLMRVPDELFDPDTDRIGRHGDRVATYGYRWVLPVRFRYQAEHREGRERMRYSFVSLERNATAPRLVAGEYGRGSQTTRLVSYPLDPESMHLVAGEDGATMPLAASDRGVGHMQGATIVNDTWYVTASRGRYGLGSLYVGRPGAFRKHRFALPVGPEDISYWPSTDQLWSLSEYPGSRYVFCIDRARLTS